MDANERLIAAAPTLLEAARLACAEMERITGDTGFEPERFREHMRLLWALSGAITRAERE